MSKYNYRIYIYFCDRSIEKVAVVDSEEEINNVISKYDESMYDKVLVIRHDRELDMDIVHDIRYISHKCLKRKIEKSDK